MKFKTTTVMLVLFAAAAWLVGCTDVSSTGPTPPDFQSEFRFVNAAQDLGNVTVSVDGQSVGSLDFMGATDHQTYPSGDRVVTLSSGDTLRVGMASEQRSTVVILPLTGAEREFVRLDERKTTNSATTDEPAFRLYDAAQSPDLNVTIAGPDTVETELAYGDNSGYEAYTAGDYTISASLAADTTDTVIGSTTVSLSNTRSTTIIVGDSTAVQFVNLTDN